MRLSWKNVLSTSSRCKRDPERPISTLSELSAYLQLILDLGFVVSPGQAVRKWPHVFWEREARAAAAAASPTGTVPADWFERFAGGERRRAWDGFAYLPGEFVERYGTTVGLEFYFQAKPEKTIKLQSAGADGYDDSYAEVWRRGVC